MTSSTRRQPAADDRSEWNRPPRPAPLAAADLRTKFIDCASSAQDIDPAALFGRLMDLCSVPRLRALAR